MVSLINKYLDGGRCEFKWAFEHLGWLITLFFKAVIKIPDVDDAVLVRCDQKRVHTRHVVDWHCYVHL